MLLVLRALRMVSVRREGQHASYTLHDHHIAELLAAVRHQPPGRPERAHRVGDLGGVALLRLMRPAHRSDRAQQLALPQSVNLRSL